jgi:hypothetical protein
MWHPSLNVILTQTLKQVAFSFPLLSFVGSIRTPHIACKGVERMSALILGRLLDSMYGSNARHVKLDDLLTSVFRVNGL